MRVIIASRIFVPEPSAASFYLNALATELAEAGHDVEVLTVTAPGDEVPSSHAAVRVRRFPVLRDARGYVRGYLQYLSFDVPLFFRLLTARRADVYVIEPPPTTGAVARVATALLRRPYVYDAADVWADAATIVTRSRVVLSILRAVERFAVRGAAHAVTISDAVAERFAAIGAGTAFTTVGFGVDAETFDYLEGAAPADARLFVYPGTFSEVQGAEILVEGFARFSETTPGYRLLFVGNGTQGELLLDRARELGVDGVEVLDAVPPAELARLIADATACVASLRPDGGYEYAFATKLFTPMAVGCPVIFAGPGPTAAFVHEAERAQRSGVAVAYDAEAVAAALSEIAATPLSPDERQKLSAWTRQHHSLASVARRVTAVIEQVHERHSSSRRSRTSD